MEIDNIGAEIERVLHARYKRETQRRVSNILNLDRAQFPGVGAFDIPMLRPVYDLPPIKEWIGFNYVLSDTNPEGKAVHFFVDDYQFERVWAAPERYLDRLKRYVCIATPDFSPYGDTPLVCQMFNHYRKLWVGRWFQDHGVTVIPTVRASTDERSLEWYLDGIPEGGAVIISSMWTHKPEAREYFYREYNTMFDKLNPCKVFLYGKRLDGLRGNIEEIETFSQRRFSKNGKRQ